MSTCNYQRGDYRCDREVDETTGDGFCIFHSPNPDKDQEAFRNGLTAHRKEHEDIFVGFIFPASFTFQEVEFPKRADFRHAEFRGEADFSDTEFTGEAIFLLVKFTAKADFSHAEFTGKADFSHAEFTGEVDFWGTKFAKIAEFEQAKFTEKASFVDAAFTREARFASAKFSGVADFSEVRFTREVDFSDAKFAEKADFRGATFTRGASFSGAKFSGETDFGGTKFTEKASFKDAIFSGRTLVSPRKGIRDVSLSVEALFSLEEGSRGSVQIFSGVDVDFRDAILKPLEIIIFCDVDLTRCRFQGTDLRQVEFVGVTWPKIAISEIWPEFIRRRWPASWLRFGVYDELRAAQKGETDTYPHIEQLYRQLKQNYEDRKDYERARDFHYGEKEMRRKNPQTSWGLWILLTLYRWVSGYGERSVLPLIWMAGILMVSTFCYFQWGLLESRGIPVCSKQLLETGLYSLQVMLLLKPSYFEPVGFGGQIIYTLQSILGPLLIGLFALAVRQRLKR